jgi:hypothetical protein
MSKHQNAPISIRGGEPVRIRVSERAVLQRVNRALKAGGRQLIKATIEQRAQGTGDYFLVDQKRIVETNIDLAKFAREQDCLKPWEETMK